MRELWINNQQVDLYPDEPIALTKQVNRLNELKDRQADYSNQFRIPPTANNLRITGFSNLVSSDSINPYSKLPCTYIENGSELISNGVAIIEEFNGEINVTCYSGIFDFFNIIGDKSLRDLDLSDANHLFNLSSVLAGNTSDKYCYPLIQWGATDKVNDIVDIRYQMPGVYVSYLMDKIFEDAGYKKAGNIFGFDSYKSLFVPIVEDQLYEEEEVLESYSFKGHIENTLEYYFERRESTAPRDINLNFNYFNSGDAFDSTAGWYSLGRYTAQNKVTVEVKFEAYIDVSNNPRTYKVGILPMVNIPDRSVVVFRILLNGQTIGINSINNFPYGGYFEIPAISNLNLNPGDKIDLQLRYFGHYKAQLPSPYEPILKTFYTDKTIRIFPTQIGESNNFSFFSVRAVNTIVLNQTISLAHLVPEIKQKDFIKDIFYIYGIVPQIDYLTRTFYFRQFEEITERANSNKQKANTNCIDWSDKLDLKSGYKVSYRLGDYGQINHLRWAQDDDRGEEGNGTILIDDNTLQKEAELFTTTFAASIQETNFKGRTGVNIKRYTPSEEEESELEFEQTESAAPRLLLLRDYGGTLNYTDGNTTLPISNSKIAYFVDPAQSFHLGFNFLIEQHYKGLSGVLRKTKVVTANFKLSENDFKNVDFFKPVYIEYFGCYFYINQITNYINGRLTSCELVRL